MIRKLLKNNGLFCGSTINKTFQSYFFAIIIAENILRLLPKKTHEWEKFVKPNFLKKILFSSGFINFDLKGDIIPARAAPAAGSIANLASS